MAGNKIDLGIDVLTKEPGYENCANKQQVLQNDPSFEKNPNIFALLMFIMTWKNSTLSCRSKYTHYNRKRTNIMLKSCMSCYGIEGDRRMVCI